MLPFMRNLKKLRRNQQIAQMSVVRRGKLITRDELFTYTNGLFLVDEDRQFARRYRKFNLDSLCDIAAPAGFSKALLLKQEDGGELIAKVPCHIAGPAFLTTASEVGTLEYIRNYTSIHVPRVLSLSPHNSNPVGPEYIMAEIKKLELIKNLTQLEAQLSAISFPAYGGLYLRTDADRLKHQDFEGNVDEQHSCIAPSPDGSFDIDAAADLPTGNGSINNGPYLGVSIAKRELSRVASQITGSQSMAHQGSPEEQIRLLGIAISLMGMLDSHPVLTQFAQPTLWHTDLHMGNIFVAPDNNSRITGLIDVQSLSPPQEYTRGLVQPVLPNDFHSLDEKDKTAALYDWTQAKMAKAYKVSSFLEDRPAHNAMNIPRVFRELFIRVGEISDIGIVLLRECLIEIFQNWSNLRIPGHCPYSFSQERSTPMRKDGSRSCYQCILREWREKNSPEEVRQTWPFPENR
ncbi:phosphotransferase enzyme family protein [Aspergillus aurantiobrunneus]